jgi:hypothetical protein
MRFHVLAALVTAAACSSQPKHTGGGGDTGGTTAPDAGPATTGDGGSPSTGALTKADCDALIAHVLDVGLADMRARKPADEVPTDEQITQLRAKLSAEMMDMCLAWDRPSYDCMMAATDPAGLEACAATPADK